VARIEFMAAMVGVVLTACGTPSSRTSGAPTAAPEETATALASPPHTPEARAAAAAEPELAISPPIAGPLRWRDYACRVMGPWGPGPSLDARDAPADAESSDVLGWYAEGRVGRLFLWRARSGLMGELRWLRRQEGAWVESGSGARRWPRHFDAESGDTLVVAAPRFAVLAHRGGADNRFLAALWLVSDSAPPRPIRYGHAVSVGGAIVTASGEVHLHLSTGFRYTDEQLVIHFAADGSELARRTVMVENGEAVRSLGASPDGLIEAFDGASRLHSYDASTAPTPLSLVPRLVEPYKQLESGVEPCPDELGLRFSHYGLGMELAPTESMLVTYEVRGAGTCVRALGVPLYAPAGALACERCHAIPEERDGPLVGHPLPVDGRTRGVHCATSPGATQPHPLERMREEANAAPAPQ